ncbi:unnamed protein product, partial [Linum tenue]
MGKLRVRERGNGRRAIGGVAGWGKEKDEEDSTEYVLGAKSEGIDGILFPETEATEPLRKPASPVKVVTKARR